VIALGIFSLGFVLGAVLFSGVQPRAPLTIHRCSVSCLSEKELLGLVGSLVMQNTPSILPNILLETDKTVVIPHPRPASEIHYVAVPKKDIRSASDIHEEDLPYLADAYASLQYFIKKERLTKYTITTNGPGYQEVGYLHFHLRAKRPR
jgi:diadenosine tetraphosphate (Ap4A) HIT family hydrolase